MGGDAQTQRGGFQSAVEVKQNVRSVTFGDLDYGKTLVVVEAVKYDDASKRWLGLNYTLVLHHQAPENHLRLSGKVVLISEG